VFRVETEPRAASFERAYAAREPAAQLERHPEFVRVRSLDDLVAPAVIVLDDIVPPPVRTVPRLTLIQGGKS
jgi:hypothetical protein